MKGLIVLAFFTIMIIPFGTNSAFAQTTYTINIPTGAASPEAPYFWQSEKDGNTDGEITIMVLDSVEWANADTAAHTVTSGTPQDGPDEIFDSSLFPPGDSFRHQFTVAGEYPYFCLVHPWMTGVVTVISQMQVLPRVGSDAGDGQTVFDVEYKFNRVISKASINEDQKSVTFEIIGRPASDDNDLTLNLPKNLIDEPFIVWVDGQQITNFELEEEGGLNIITLPLTEQSELVTLVGASIVPEFGPIAWMILGIAVLSMVAITSKTQKFGIPKF